MIPAVRAPTATSPAPPPHHPQSYQQKFRPKRGSWSKVTWLVRAGTSDFKSELCREAAPSQLSTSTPPFPFLLFLPLHTPFSPTLSCLIAKGNSSRDPSPILLTRPPLHSHSTSGPLVPNPFIHPPNPRLLGYVQCPRYRSRCWGTEHSIHNNPLTFTFRWEETRVHKRSFYRSLGNHKAGRREVVIVSSTVRANLKEKVTWQRPTCLQRTGRCGLVDICKKRVWGERVEFKGPKAMAIRLFSAQLAQPPRARTEPRRAGVLLHGKCFCRCP